MRLFITADFVHESGINEVLDILDGTGYINHFESISYGDGLIGVCIVLMCQEQSLGLKKRIRFSRKEKTIYMDIMLNLDEYITATPYWRVQNTLNKILNEMPAIIRKYKVKEFNTEQFISDVTNWFTGQLPSNMMKKDNH
jgi:hypothetical protein